MTREEGAPTKQRCCHPEEGVQRLSRDRLDPCQSKRSVLRRSGSSWHCWNSTRSSWKPSRLGIVTHLYQNTQELDSQSQLKICTLNLFWSFPFSSVHYFLKTAHVVGGQTPAWSSLRTLFCILLSVIEEHNLPSPPKKPGVFPLSHGNGLYFPNLGKGQIQIRLYRLILTEGPQTNDAK